MVTTREVEWDDTERSYVLALMRYESQVCGCGGYLPDTTHEDNEGGYVASAPIRCYRCDAVQRKQSQYSDPKKTQFPVALTVWPVERGDRG